MKIKFINLRGIQIRRSIVVPKIFLLKKTGVIYKRCVFLFKGLLSSRCSGNASSSKNNCLSTKSIMPFAARIHMVQIHHTGENVARLHWEM